MKNPEERSQKIVAIINTIKKDFPSFTKEEFMKAIKSRNCPYATSILSILKDKNLVIQSSDKMLTWSLETPVHFKVIQSRIDKLASAHKIRQDNWLNKKNSIDSKELIPIKSVSLEEAIKIIKQNGGKVYMPKIKFEEV